MVIKKAFVVVIYPYGAAAQKRGKTEGTGIDEGNEQSLKGKKTEKRGKIYVGDPRKSLVV